MTISQSDEIDQLLTESLESCAGRNRDAVPYLALHKVFFLVVKVREVWESKSWQFITISLQILWNITLILGQKSAIYPKIHFLKVSFFT